MEQIQSTPTPQGGVGAENKDCADVVSNDKDSKYLGENQHSELVFRQIGNDFFKDAIGYDVKGRPQKQTIKLSRQTIAEKWGKHIFANIPYYDAAVIVPSHTNYQREIGSCWNIYNQLSNIPKKGEHPTFDMLMRRVFGEQLALGWDYLTLAYLFPLQILPILCLVSVENHTGKTSFGNALSYIFGHNVGFCAQDDLSSRYNVWLKNLFAVFEEISETKNTLNKIKAMSTAQSAMLDEKYLSQMKFQPFVKILILSNNDSTFIKANEEDIRYWVRTLKPIPEDEFISNFDERIMSEVPAILHTLANRELSTQKKSRMWFDPKDLVTDGLKKIRKESRSEIVQDLEIVINELLQDRNEFYTTPTELAEHLRPKVYSVSKITAALQKELGYKPKKQMRFTNLNGDSKNGTPYHFTLSEELRALKRESCEAEVPDDCLPY